MIPEAVKLHESTLKCGDDTPTRSAVETTETLESDLCSDSNSDVDSCSEYDIHPSDYENEIEETSLILLELPCDLTCRIRIPRITLTSQHDPTVFYRIPVGFGFWDAAHCLGVALGECKGQIAELCDADLMGQSFPSVPSIGPESSVVELGGGAVPALALMAHHLGAQDVVATDYVPEIVAMAQSNIAANCVGTNIRAVMHGFGDDPAPMFHRSNKKTFDVVTGADIMAVPREVSLLLAATLREITKIGSAVVLAWTKRMRDNERGIIEMFHPQFAVVGRRLDDTNSRWRKYGRVAHNARAGTQPEIEIVTLLRVM